MMRGTGRVHGPRGSSAHGEAGGILRCDRQAEDMLKSFFPTAADGAALPPELRGLSEGAQSGLAGVRRSLTLEAGGERLRIEVTAVGKDRTQFHLWREPMGDTAAAGVDAVAPADGLTTREREVALLVSDGLRSREVAERLGIASQTVKSHLKTIFDKLGVRNRVELARRLVHH
jgi:DNA-binding CsgD family transcriptional regulator